MSALNRQETEYLAGAQKVLTTLEGVLKRLEEGETIPESEIKWLRNVTKKALDGVRTVKTMKGYYPK